MDANVVDQVSRLFLVHGVGAIPSFCGHQLSDLANAWTILFGDGRVREIHVLPDELAEVQAACRYKDELEPRIKWRPKVGCYLVTRRTA